MAIEVQGAPILSYGEFIALSKGFPDDYVGSGILQGLWAGQDYAPVTVHAAFNVGLRMAAQTPEAEQLIELVLSRLEDAFPDESFPMRS